MRTYRLEDLNSAHLPVTEWEESTPVHNADEALKTEYVYEQVMSYLPKVEAALQPISSLDYIVDESNDEVDESSRVPPVRQIDEVARLMPIYMGLGAPMIRNVSRMTMRRAMRSR